jgi:hypothetical protein
MPAMNELLRDEASSCIGAITCGGWKTTLRTIGAAGVRMLIAMSARTCRT